MTPLRNLPAFSLLLAARENGGSTLFMLGANTPGVGQPSVRDRFFLDAQEHMGQVPACILESLAPLLAEDPP